MLGQLARIAATLHDLCRLLSIASFILSASRPLNFSHAIAGGRRSFEKVCKHLEKEGCGERAFCHRLPICKDRISEAKTDATIAAFAETRSALR